MSGYSEWHDYFWPGTTVLRNKLGEHDPIKLKHREVGRTALRLAQVVATPPPGDWDYYHYQAFHRYIFETVYDWAGTPRAVPWDRPMVKHFYDVRHFPEIGPGKREYQYLAGMDVERESTIVFAELAQHRHLAGLPFESFTEQLTKYWARINLIHCFREGNTRTQFAFFTCLSREAGWDLDFARFKIGPARDYFVAARYYAMQMDDPGHLHAIIADAITMSRPTPPTGIGGHWPGPQTPDSGISL